MLSYGRDIVEGAKTHSHGAGAGFLLRILSINIMIEL